MDKTEKMFSLVDQYHRSGLTMKVFAKQYNIPRTSFLYWVQKKEQSKKKGNFLPISFPSDKFRSAQIEILYPNGVKVLLASPDKERLREYINLFGC